MEKDRPDKPTQPTPQPSEPTPPKDQGKAEPAAKPPEVIAPAAKPSPEPDKPGANVEKPPAGPEKLPAVPEKAAADKPAAAPDKPVASAAKPVAPPGGDDDTMRNVPSPVPSEVSRNTPVAPIPAAPGGPLPATERMGGMGPQVDPSGHSLDSRVAHRRWLEAKSKDDLIALILKLEKEQPGLDVTEKMMKVKLSGPLAAPADSFKIPDDLPYLRLPVLRAQPANEPTPTWRIVLISLEQNNKPVGLIIDAEITIGRTAGGSTPDLDLTAFGASLKGVSRIHAKLRPTMHSLILLDNKSSNGTYCNRSRVAPEIEQPLKEGDVIAFGQAYFLIRIIKSPDAGEARTLI